MCVAEPLLLLSPSPMFGYKNHIGIDRAHGLIRTWDTSATNAHELKSGTGQT